MWFNYPVEKNVIRFYKYKFQGVSKPIVVEALNKFEARNKLVYIMQSNPVLRQLKVVDETVTLPVIGLTTKEINKIPHIWVGKYAINGWIRKDEYDKLNL